MAIKKINVACVHRRNISQYDSGERCGPWASCLISFIYLFIYCSIRRNGWTGCKQCMAAPKHGVISIFLHCSLPPFLISMQTHVYLCFISQRVNVGLSLLTFSRKYLISRNVIKVEELFSWPDTCVQVIQILINFCWNFYLILFTWKLCETHSKDPPEATILLKFTIFPALSEGNKAQNLHPF
jgi:hypothetical protein